MLRPPKEKGASVITPVAPLDTTYSNDITEAGQPAQHLKALYFGLYNTGAISLESLSKLFARNPDWRAA